MYKPFVYGASRRYAQELVTLVRITRILNQFDHDSVIYGREGS